MSNILRSVIITDNSKNFFLKTVCLIVTIFICLSATGQLSGSLQDKQEEIKLRHGKRIKTYYSNGILMSVTNYDENNRKHGEYLRYYRSGNLKLKASYNHGKRCGDWFGFSNNGALSDIINSDTTKISKWEWYFIHKTRRLDIKGKKYIFRNGEGNVLAKGRYKNGMRVGKWKFYYENGKLKSKGKYRKNCREGRWKEYHNNGKLRSNGKFNSDAKDGYWKEYDTKGQYKLTQLFNDGKIEGKPFYKNIENTIQEKVKDFKDFYLVDYNGKVIPSYNYDIDIFLVIVTENMIGKKMKLGLTDQLDSMFKIGYLNVYNIVIEGYEIKSDIDKIKLIPKELTAF